MCDSPQDAVKNPIEDLSRLDPTQGIHHAVTGIGNFLEDPQRLGLAALTLGGSEAVNAGGDAITTAVDNYGPKKPSQPTLPSGPAIDEGFMQVDQASLRAAMRMRRRAAAANSGAGGSSNGALATGSLGGGPGVRGLGGLG